MKVEGERRARRFLYNSDLRLRVCWAVIHHEGTKIPKITRSFLFVLNHRGTEAQRSIRVVGWVGALTKLEG